MNPQSTEVKPVATSETESHGAPPSSGKKVWLYVVPAIFLALFGGLVYRRIQTRLQVQAGLVPASADASLTPVAVTHPQRSDANQELELPGNVQAFVETPIYARTDGYLKRWYVDIGGHVKAGELLASIDTPEVDQELLQTQAAVLQAQANLDLAKSTAERWHTLLKSDGVSQQEVDQNDAAYKARQADLNAADANVQRLKYLQSFQQITAPFAGVLTARNVDIGALISNGNTKPLFQLAQIDVLRVYVNVPEPYGNVVQPGISVELHVAEFANRVFPGKVVHTAGAIDPVSRTLLTEIQVQNPRDELMPGSYAEVKFHVKSGSSALLVPSNALLFRSGPQVAVVDDNGRVHLRSVTIGRDLGSQLEILSGLQPTDSIVINPSDSIMNGDAVAVQQAQPSSTAGR